MYQLLIGHDLQTVISLEMYQLLIDISTTGTFVKISLFTNQDLSTTGIFVKISLLTNKDISTTGTFVDRS
jgi:hypothetical protein